MEINIEQIYHLLHTLSSDKDYKNNLDSMYGIAVKIIDLHKDFSEGGDDKQFKEEELEQYKEKVHTERGNLQSTIQSLLDMLPDDAPEEATQHLKAIETHTEEQSGGLLDKIEQLSRSNLLGNLQALAGDGNLSTKVQAIFAILEGLNDSQKELKENVKQHPQSEEHEEWFKSNVEDKQKSLFETIEAFMKELPEELHEEAKPHIEKVRSKNDAQIEDLIKLLGLGK